MEPSSHGPHGRHHIVVEAIDIVCREGRHDRLCNIVINFGSPGDLSGSWVSITTDSYFNVIVNFITTSIILTYRNISHNAVINNFAVINAVKTYRNISHQCGHNLPAIA